MKKKHSAIIRKREAEVADRLSPSWNGEDPKPVLSAEGISYEVSEKIHGVSYGGLGLLRQIVKWSGLGKAIDQGVKLFKRHQPYHESDHVLSLIYNVATGGTRYQDIEMRRQSVSFLEAVGAEKIPAPSTAGDFVRRFQAPDVIDLMEAVNESRRKVWAQQPARFFERAEIDVDGTIAPTSGECKEGMEISYDGQWGYAPLIVTLAQTGEVLYAVNRSGNRPSHEGAPEWLDRSIELVREAGFRTVRLRGDTDFSLTAHFDRWTEAGVEFDFGMDAHPSFIKWAEALPQANWKELVRPGKEKGKGKKRRKRRDKVKPEIVKERGFKTLRLEREEIVEIDYRPSKAKRTYRLVILRKTILVEKGQKRLLPQTRYHFYVTNIPAAQLGTAGVVRENNRRCNQENVIEQLKNGVEALRMPVDGIEHLSRLGQRHDQRCIAPLPVVADLHPFLAFPAGGGNRAIHVDLRPFEEPRRLLGPDLAAALIDGFHQIDHIRRLEAAHKISGRAGRGDLLRSYRFQEADTLTPHFDILIAGPARGHVVDQAQHVVRFVVRLVAFEQLHPLINRFPQPAPLHDLPQQPQPTVTDAVNFLRDLVADAFGREDRFRILTVPTGAQPISNFCFPLSDDCAMLFLHLKCLLSGLSEVSLLTPEYPSGLAFQVFTRGLIHFHLLVLGLVPSDVDLWRFRVRLTRADDTETFSREILMPINRVSVARGVTPLTRSNNLQQGSNVDFFYPIEFNVNGSATLEAELVFKTGSFFPVVKVVPLGQFADGFHPKSTFQFSETIPLDATSFSVWVSLSGTPLPARADKKVYASIRAPEFAIPTFVNQTAGVLGLDLTPVQAGLNRSVDVIRNRRNLLTSALDVLSTTTTSPTDTSTSALPEGVGSPFPDFVQTASYWQIVPPVSGEVFTGDLTLHYSEEDLPDDLGFFEEDLQIVSVDSSGVFRTHETTVDLDVLTATTRVAGLESVYGLAVVGPFFERTLNFPVLRSTFDLFTGLAFLNLGIDTAELELYAFDPAGIEYDAAENDGVVFLEPGEQLPRLARELFDFQTSNNEGWVQVYSDTPDVVGFELLSNATVLDGVDVKAALAPTVVLTRIEYDDDRSTEIHVGNPTIFDNPVEIELWTSSGIVETYETTLGAKEKAEHRIEDLFPGLTKGFVGYAIVRGDYDVSAVELLVTEDSMAALNGQVRIPGSSVSEELYSAQLATGGGASETRLNVVNTTGLAAGLVVRAVGENGASLAPAVNVQLGPGEQLERDVGPLFGFDSNVLTVGSIVIESSITGILGDVAFGDPSSARAFRASLPLDPRPSKTAAFAQVANGAGFFTGFAAFNPNGSATAVTIATFAANGASTGSGSLNLAAGGRVSKLLPEVVASSAGQVGGYFTVTSDLPISSFSLFGTQTLSALSAVPAQGRDLTVQ